jgi:hypothetical protein
MSEGNEEQIPPDVRSIPPEVAQMLFENYAQRERNGLPTTLDYRLKAIEVGVALLHHGVKVKSSQGFITEVVIPIEVYLRQE